MLYLQKASLLNTISFSVAELCVKIEAVKKNNEDGKRGAKVKVNFFLSKSFNKSHLLVTHCMNQFEVDKEGGRQRG